MVYFCLKGDFLQRRGRKKKVVKKKDKMNDKIKELIAQLKDEDAEGRIKESKES